jgi:hypothetical protein
MAYDDKPLTVIRRDVSGGLNNRYVANLIQENQCSQLVNADIGPPGQVRKRPGSTILACLASNPGTGLYGFEPRAGINRLVATYAGQIKWSPVSSGFATIASVNVSTPGLATTMVKAGETGTYAGDVLILSDGTNNMLRVEPGTPSFQDLGNTNLSPPKSTVMTYYRNRLWVLFANQLAWSSALPLYNASLSGYATAFDRTTNVFNMPVGQERALIGIRDMGLVALGNDAVWGINPSVVPVATDKPEKIIEYGCVAGNTAQQVGDDIMYLAKDGVRGVFRTQQDKLQTGTSFPISYGLREEMDTISWAYVSKACAVVFDNKYFLSLPVNGSTYNNQVWILYPATQGWVKVSGWNVAAWSTIQISGEQRLYYIDSVNSNVYRAWKGFTDNGVAIPYLEVGRGEDMGAPLQKKVGGEVSIKAEISGNYNIEVYINLDNSGYNWIGNLNLAGALITFPITFPVTFPPQNIAYDKFHIDSLGEWFEAKIKLEHTTTNTSDIRILERGILTYSNEYYSEKL